MKQMSVYILASRRHGTLYIGVTNNLVRRIFEHRNACVPGFTRKYNVNRLVYFEQHETPEDAIAREKALKHWPRAKKIQLVEADNPDWHDLYDEICK